MKNAEEVEVYETPYGEVVCGRCGYELECNECGDMPETCPQCGASLDYGFVGKYGEDN